MSACCVSIEWAFGDVVKYFAFVDFQKQMKIMEKPLSHLYEVAVFLTSLATITCGGNKTSVFYDLEPPKLAEYLHSLN